MLVFLIDRKYSRIFAPTKSILGVVCRTVESPHRFLSIIIYDENRNRGILGRIPDLPVAWWYGMVEVCEGAPVAVSGWVLTDRHAIAPCAANSLHRETISVSNIIGGTGTLGIA